MSDTCCDRNLCGHEDECYCERTPEKPCTCSCSVIAALQAEVEALRALGEATHQRLLMIRGVVMRGEVLIIGNSDLIEKWVAALSRKGGGA